MTLLGLILIAAVFLLLLMIWAACAQAGRADEDMGAKTRTRR